MVQFQKLTRNLFLTLHGHNVHRQQRQLSKFLMRYQQFASRAYCGAARLVTKMASQQEKAFCVLRFEVYRSVITVQHEFLARFRKDAPCMVAPTIHPSLRPHACFTCQHVRFSRLTANSPVRLPACLGCFWLLLLLRCVYFYSFLLSFLFWKKRE